MNCKKLLVTSMILTSCILCAPNVFAAQPIKAQVSKSYVDISRLIEYNNYSDADQRLKEILKKKYPKFMSGYIFRKKMGYFCNLKNPKTFNEKIQYLKFNQYKDNKLVTECADKYKVREYIIKKGLEDTLVPLLGVWDKVEEVKFNELPNEFVLKCNHGSGYNIICADKLKLNTEKCILKLREWLEEDFSLKVLEPHYANIKKRIIAEKYLGQEVLDYKFFCFAGNPEFLYISRVVPNTNGLVKCCFWDSDGNRAEFERTDELFFDNHELPKLPKAFGEMKRIASVLSSDFPFVRVDLFCVDEKIYFSELTFTPAAGMMPFKPQKWDRIWGDKIKLD